MFKGRKKYLIIILSVLILGIAVYLFFDKPKPQGEQNANAEKLAQRMLHAINHQNWQDSTGLVLWNFDDRQYHIWDKKRHYAKVSWSNYEVWFAIDSREGKVLANGKEITDEAKKSKLIEKAWKHWVNDSFWLNPISKIYDPGTIRQEVSYKGRKSTLLVTYLEGGNTPGDSYLWFLDKNGLPYKWKLWVNIIPIGGMAFTWENWITTETGVKIATLHKSPLFSIDIKDVQTAKTYSDIFAQDEFAFLEK